MREFVGTRIYFSPCGMGLGHVGRTISIAEELIRRGADVMFSTYLEGVEFVKIRGIPVVTSPALSLESDSTGRIDLRASFLSTGVHAIPRFMEQVTSELKFMQAFKPDVVFSDTRLSSIIAGKLMGLPVALMLNQFMPMVPRTDENATLSQFVDGSILTLLGQGWGSSDVILIPDFPQPHTLSLDSLRIPEAYRHLVRMIGAILPRKSEDVEETSRVRKEAGAGECDRLIYAAISGPTQERDPLIKLLTPVLEGFPEGYKIVMSLGDPGKGSNPSSSGALTVIPWVEDRFEYLKACELVICRGGHNTIMQSISYGKPSIIIPTPNHTEQYTNARRATELCVAKATHQKDVSTTRLLELVEELLNGSEYRNRLDKMQSRDYFNGIEKAIEAISELLSK